MCAQTLVYSLFPHSHIRCYPTRPGRDQAKHRQLYVLSVIRDLPQTSKLLVVIKIRDFNPRSLAWQSLTSTARPPSH